MDKFINPFTDFGFKRLFGSEFNKELLIDFLNEVLDHQPSITELTYLNTEHVGRSPLDRKAIFDVYCRNEQGERFIIELQNIKQLYFKDRSLFYSTFPIQEQAEKGKDWDYRLAPVYTIGILDFMFEDKGKAERYTYEVKLIETKTQEIFYDKLTFIYLEMPSFTKSEEELETKFDKWLYVLKHLSSFQERPVALQERIFSKLFEAAEIAQLKPEDMNTYQESLKVYRDNQNTMNYAIETAKKEARLEGLKEGQLAERQKIAKSLKAQGVSPALISKSTGLSVQEIEQL